MKATRLLVAALAGMYASMGTAALNVLRDAHAPKPRKTLAPSRTVGSSRNGGRRGTNAQARRAARKARNVKRHRAHCKGPSHV